MPLPGLTLKNLLGNLSYALLPHLLSGEDAKALENGMAIRLKEPGFLNDAVGHTPFPPNFYHQLDFT